MQEVQPQGRGLRRVGSIWPVGQMSYLSLCQGSASHALERGAHRTPPHIFWGSSGLASQYSNEISCLMWVSRLQQLGSISIQPHPSFKNLAQQQGREFPLFVCWSNSDLWRREIICVWVARSLLAPAAATAWGLLASGKTSAAGPALGWDLKVVSIWPGPTEELWGSQDHSCDAKENCTMKNLQKEQLVDVQTGSWPRHSSYPLVLAGSTEVSLATTLQYLAPNACAQMTFQVLSRALVLSLLQEHSSYQLSHRQLRISSASPR